MRLQLNPELADDDVIPDTIIIRTRKEENNPEEIENRKMCVLSSI
jgi:hypothetical protein